MVFIEIIREYKCCWQVGQRREVSDEFAHVLIEGGYARKVEREIRVNPQTPVVETGKT